NSRGARPGRSGVGTAGVLSRKGPGWLADNGRTDSGFLSSRFGGTGLISDRWWSPSLSLTLGGRGDHWGGYISLGRVGLDTSLHGAIYYDAHHHHHHLRHLFGHGHLGYYYSHYYPAFYPYYDYVYSYPVWYGYTYTSVYYPEPYVYRPCDTTVYIYEEGPPEPGEVDDRDASAVAPPVPYDVPPSEPPKDDPNAYRPLTAPDETTDVGRGNAAFLAGRYEDARREYIRAVMIDERDGHAKLLYAYANFATGDFEVAATALRRALLTTPSLMDYPVDLRVLYGNPEDLDVHLAELTAYVNARPADRAVAVLLAYIHYAIGHPAEALRILNPMAEGLPQDSLIALLRDAIVRTGLSEDP
ncbi:MAG: hypothetical protein D6788_05900, partial [Planctomycetota bacterium]